MVKGREKGKGGHGLGSAKGEVDEEEAKSEVALALYASESDGMPRSRKDILSFAKLAEKSNCDDDLLIAANHLVDLSKKRELDNEERNLVSIAYKLYVGKRRTAWQALVPIRAQWGEYKYGHSNSPSADPESDIRASWTDDYIHKIEQELEDICAEINLIIEEKLLPTLGSMEGKVFFRKMAADYCRYLAEFRAGEHRKEAGELALRNYKLASALAENHLRATNPVRLGLALNFSVFTMKYLAFMTARGTSQMWRMTSTCYFRWPSRGALQIPQSSCSCCRTTSKFGRRKREMPSRCRSRCRSSSRGMGKERMTGIGR